MLIAVDNRTAPIGTIADGDRHDLELLWTVSVDGEPAGHHRLRVAGAPADVPFAPARLPRWSALTTPWASSWRWSSEVRPRVLRRTDAFADRLGVTDTAPALLIVERGTGRAGEYVEHELIVLARFADQALPSGWQSHSSRSQCVAMAR